MHDHLLVICKSNALSISALEKHLNYSLIYPVRDTGDLKRRHLIIDIDILCSLPIKAKIV